MSAKLPHKFGAMVRYSIEEAKQSPDLMQYVQRRLLREVVENIVEQLLKLSTQRGCVELEYQFEKLSGNQVFPWDETKTLRAQVEMKRPRRPQVIRYRPVAKLTGKNFGPTTSLDAFVLCECDACGARERIYVPPGTRGVICQRRLCRCGRWTRYVLKPEHDVK